MEACLLKGLTLIWTFCRKKNHIPFFLTLNDTPFMHSACKCPIFAKYFALVKTTSWMQVLRFESKKVFIENLQDRNF